MILVMYKYHNVDGEVSQQKVIAVDDKKESYQFARVNADKVSRAFSRNEDSDKAISEMIATLLNPLQMNLAIAEQLKIRKMSRGEKILYIKENASKSKVISEMLKRSDTFGWGE